MRASEYCTHASHDAHALPGVVTQGARAAGRGFARAALCGGEHLLPRAARHAHADGAGGRFLTAALGGGPQHGLQGARTTAAAAFAPPLPPHTWAASAKWLAQHASVRLLTPPLCAGRHRTTVHRGAPPPHFVAWWLGGRPRRRFYCAGADLEAEQRAPAGPAFICGLSGAAALELRRPAIVANAAPRRARKSGRARRSGRAQRPGRWGGAQSRRRRGGGVCVAT